MSKWIITVRNNDDAKLREMEKSPDKLFLRVAFGAEVEVRDIQQLMDTEDGAGCEGITPEPPRVLIVRKLHDPDNVISGAAYSLTGAEEPARDEDADERPEDFYREAREPRYVGPWPDQPPLKPGEYERITGRKSRPSGRKSRPSLATEPFPGQPADDCVTCRKVHTPPEVMGPNGVHFWPGHEYVIRTRIGTQKLPREWRMGYIGFGYGLEFSARGPDRTHSDQYGGTQQIGLESIIYAKEVARDDVKRHVGRIVR